MKYTFEIVELNKDTWYRIENTIDSNIFVSEQWCNYLHTIGYTPLVITVSNDDIKKLYEEKKEKHMRR